MAGKVDIQGAAVFEKEAAPPVQAQAPHQVKLAFAEERSARRDHCLSKAIRSPLSAF
jgi:hypothetical protein